MPENNQERDSSNEDSILSSHTINKNVLQPVQRAAINCKIGKKNCVRQYHLGLKVSTLVAKDRTEFAEMLSPTKCQFFRQDIHRRVLPTCRLNKIMAKGFPSRREQQRNGKNR